MQNMIQKELVRQGYKQYEVSAYAQEQQQCQHNMNYWQFGDYLGIGAGAHGKLSLDDDTIVRLWKRKHPQSYIDADNKLGGRNLVPENQIAFEFMLNALRLNDGFKLKLFEARTGMASREIETLLDKHEQAGMLERSDDIVRPTKFGHERINLMLEDYLP